MLKNIQQFAKIPSKVPNVKEKVDLIIKGYHLRVKKNILSFLDHNLHSYTTLALDQKDRQVVFKARLWDDPLIKLTFRNEINVTDFFSQNPNLQKGFGSRKIFAWEKNDDLDWAIYAFQPGRELTKKDSSEIIINTLLALQQVPVKLLPPAIAHHHQEIGRVFNPAIKPNEKNPDLYLKQLSSYLNSLSQFFSLPKGIEPFVKSCRTFLSDKEKVLVHGDPTINNFILNDRKIIIFDWEYTRLSESSYDFAYLYLWAWEDHHWRKTLIDKALKKIESPDKFKLFFRVNLILIALYHLYQVIHQISAFTEHKTSKYQQLLQRAVDSKLISIEQATNDFEELLK